MEHKFISVALLSMLGLPALSYDVRTAAQGGAGVAEGDFTFFLRNPAHLNNMEQDDADGDEESTEGAAQPISADPVLSQAVAGGEQNPEQSAAAVNDASESVAPASELAAPEEEASETDGKAGIGFAFAINAAAILHDPEDLIDNMDSTVDAIDALKVQGWTDAARDTAMTKLADINGAYISAQANASSYIAVPNTVIPLGLFINSKIKAAGRVDIGNALDVIDQLGGGDEFNPDDVTDSWVSASAIWSTDIGLSAAHVFQFNEASALKVGTSLKYQQVSLYDYFVDNVDDFDEDEIENCDSKASGANIDLGVSYTFQEWLSIGFVAENLISKDYTSKLGNVYELKPQYTLGVAAQYGIVTFMADVELVENSGFIEVAETQYANIGAKLNFWRQASLSVGYQIDMKGNDENLFSVGIGISPGDVVSMDLVGMLGSDTYGAGIRFGVKF